LSNYQTLLSIAVEHSYYLSGVCPCLDFNPTQRTAAILENAGLMCKKTVDGIQIVYDRSRLEALEMYANDLDEPLSFDFKIYSHDPEFRSYTEPFAAGEGDILYFDNRAVNGAGKQSISVSKYASSKDLKKPDSSELEGILSQKDRLSPPEFVLRIFANTDKGSLLEQWLEPEPMVYSIGFFNRQRHWKYYLLGKMVNRNKPSDGFSIIDPDNKVEFEAMGEERLSDQRTAYTFRSKQPIPLNEFYSYRFQLKQKGRDNESIVIQRLPFASVGHVGTDEVAEQATMVAEIYINS